MKLQIVCMLAKEGAQPRYVGPRPFAMSWKSTTSPPAGWAWLRSGGPAQVDNDAVFGPVGSGPLYVARINRATNIASESASRGQMRTWPGVGCPVSGCGKGSHWNSGWDSRNPASTWVVSRGVRVQTE